MYFFFFLIRIALPCLSTMGRNGKANLACETSWLPPAKKRHPTIISCLPFFRVEPWNLKPLPTSTKNIFLYNCLLLITFIKITGSNPDLKIRPACKSPYHMLIQSKLNTDTCCLGISHCSHHLRKRSLRKKNAATNNLKICPEKKICAARDRL